MHLHHNYTYNYIVKRTDGLILMKQSSHSIGNDDEQRTNSIFTATMKNKLKLKSHTICSIYTGPLVCIFFIEE